MPVMQHQMTNQTTQLIKTEHTESLFCFQCSKF